MTYAFWNAKKTVPPVRHYTYGDTISLYIDMQKTRRGAENETRKTTCDYILQRVYVVYWTRMYSFITVEVWMQFRRYFV